MPRQRAAARPLDLRDGMDEQARIAAWVPAMARAIIIDTDPGIDDAVAILMALAAAEELAVLGLVAVAGNLPLAACARNLRQICELAGRPDLAVYAGCAGPLLRPLATAAGIHRDALRERLQLPRADDAAKVAHGVDFLVDSLRAAETGAVALCALGPLTDIAMALVKAPDIAARIGELVIMGGAGFEIGNVTPAAEFNIHVDPHAAEIVLASGVPITMIPLDATHQVLSTPARMRRCTASAIAAGRRWRICWRRSRRPAPPVRGARHGAARPVRVAYLLRPELFSGRVVNVAVETASALTIG